MSDMTNKPNQLAAQEEGKKGLGKVSAGIITCILSSYIMNQASLHGVDFKLMGLSSELVKATIDGTVVGILVGLTPTHFVASLVDGIIVAKQSWKQIINAFNN